MELSPDQYAALMRKQLLTQQLIQALAVPASFYRRKPTNYWRWRCKSMTYIWPHLISRRGRRSRPRAMIEIQASYNAHKNQYLSPEIFKVSYIPMDAEAMQAKTSVDKQQIQSWYDQHYDQCTFPARKRYSFIQSKNKSDANDWLK